MRFSAARGGRKYPAKQSPRRVVCRFTAGNEERAPRNFPAVCGKRRSERLFFLPRTAAAARARNAPCGIFRWYAARCRGERPFPPRTAAAARTRDAPRRIFRWYAARCRDEKPFPPRTAAAARARNAPCGIFRRYAANAGVKGCSSHLEPLPRRGQGTPRVGPSGTPVRCQKPKDTYQFIGPGGGICRPQTKGATGRRTADAPKERPLLPRVAARLFSISSGLRPLFPRSAGRPPRRS